jgi:ribosomal protein S8
MNYNPEFIYDVLEKLQLKKNPNLKTYNFNQNEFGKFLNNMSEEQLIKNFKPVKTQREYLFANENTIKMTLKGFLYLKNNHLLKDVDLKNSVNRTHEIVLDTLTRLNNNDCNIKESDYNIKTDEYGDILEMLQDASIIRNFKSAQGGVNNEHNCLFLKNLELTPTGLRFLNSNIN